MKIAIASDDGKFISSHFGRAEGFVIFEIQDRQVKFSEFRPNSFTGNALGMEGLQGGDKHKIIIEALKDCDVVISKGMGRRLYEDLKEAGINAIITEEDSVEKALELYMEGILTNHPDKGCHHKEDKECRREKKGCRN